MTDRITAAELEDIQQRCIELRASLRGQPDLQALGLDRILGTTLFLVAEVRRLRSLIRRTYPLVDLHREGQKDLAEELQVEVVAQRQGAEETPPPGALHEVGRGKE